MTLVPDFRNMYRVARSEEEEASLISSAKLKFAAFVVTAGIAAVMALLLKLPCTTKHDVLID